MTATTAQPPQESPPRRPPDPALAVERRPLDIAWLVVSVIGVLLAWMWAAAETDVDQNLCSAINGLGNAFEGAANVLAALGSIWCVLAVVALLLVLRWFNAARAAAIAGAGAWLIGTGINALADTRHVAGLNVRTGSGPEFLAVSVATAMALLVAVAPYISRPYRRLGLLVVVLVGCSAVYLGTGLASDVVGGFLLGIACGAAVQVAFGAPGGRPSEAELQEALGELGFEVATMTPDELAIPQATVVDAHLTSGDAIRAIAFGRDQRDGQLFARVWRSLAYKEPGVAVFGSRLQQVEHLAYASLIASAAGVASPRALKTGVAGPDAALLVTSRVSGTPLGELRIGLTDAVLGSVWSELTELHGAGIAHGDLDASRLLIDGSSVAFLDLGRAYVNADGYWMRRDLATLLVITARLAGNDRAIASALTALGTEELGKVIPYVQPAVLPKPVRKGQKHLAKQLKTLRADLSKTTGIDDIPPLKVQRLSLVNIGMLAGILLALAIAIPSLKDVNWQSVQDEFSNATWGWAVLALVLYPLVPMSWATALMGCVNTDLPFVPTTLVQLACSFLNLITPNGIGGTALQLDYLHHQDVPVASGASAMVLSTGVGGAIQMGLFLLAVTLTATTIDTSSSGGGGVALGAIAVVAALIGVILLIPKIRGKVVPAVKRAATDIFTVLRNPRKGAQLFGGDLAGNLIYPALLGLCLLAFHQHLAYAQLVVVQIGAGMLGGAAPVPGGIGVQEAALTAGLTSFGIPANPALATVLVFRGITFALPPVFGFFTLRRLRAQGLA
jgi:uncharacterized membrane protein YbhN (UPF0104 family)/membrane-associated phospholipid phosphatase